MAGSESGLGGVIAGLENCASQGKFFRNMIRFGTNKIWHIINGLEGDKHGPNSKGQIKPIGKNIKVGKTVWQAVKVDLVVS